MISRTTARRLLFVLVLLMGLTSAATAEDQIAVNMGVDLYNRYVWRGLDFGNTPSIQPSLSVAYAGIELGTWGAYTLSNEASESDEIDFWLAYSREIESGVSFTAIVTDYYFPNAGIALSNFNDYDAVIDDTIPDPGAHTLEVGLSIGGPASFPFTLSGYVNVYNDAGNNSYFQLDYPVTIDETALTLFCGATPGSKENRGYYGTGEFRVINLGLTASREIIVSETFSVPLSVSFIVNPEADISHLLVGVSF